MVDPFSMTRLVVTIDFSLASLAADGLAFQILVTFPLLFEVALNSNSLYETQFYMIDRKGRGTNSYLFSLDPFTCL